VNSETLNPLLLLAALLVFASLFVNLLFAVVFRKRIHRSFTVAVSLVAGAIGFVLPWSFGPIANDPAYLFVSSFVSCVLCAISTSFVQVIQKLPKDKAN